MHRKFYNILFFILMWAGIIFVWICTLLAFISGIKYIIKRRAKNRDKPHIAYLECMFSGNAGYVYRTSKWVEILNQNGYKAKDFSIMKKELHQLHIEHWRNTFAFHMRNLFWRILQCVQVLKYDVVIVRRELILFNEYGNMFLERFLLTAHPIVVYDFDDDIGASKKEMRKTSFYGKCLLERPGKFSWILRNINYFIPGSPILNNIIYKRRYGKPYQSVVLPTLVDYYKSPPRKFDSSIDKLTIGWIGGAYNLPYLQDIIEPLNKLSEHYPLRLLVVCSLPFVNNRIKFENVFIKWEQEKELEHIEMMDVGIMPLRNNSRERGKCGFKLIQYMGHGVPGIGSNIGVNSNIIDDGINGFLVDNINQWEAIFEHILTHKEILPSLSISAYNKIKDHYSYPAHTQAFFKFIHEITH